MVNWIWCFPLFNVKTWNFWLLVICQNMLPTTPKCQRKGTESCGIYVCRKMYEQKYTWRFLLFNAFLSSSPWKENKKHACLEVHFLLMDTLITDISNSAFEHSLITLINVEISYSHIGISTEMYFITRSLDFPLLLNISEQMLGNGNGTYFASSHWQ